MFGFGVDKFVSDGTGVCMNDQRGVRNFGEEVFFFGPYMGYEVEFKGIACHKFMVFVYYSGSISLFCVNIVFFWFVFVERVLKRGAKKNRTAGPC